jgi:chromosome partitioning protein
VCPAFYRGRRFVTGLNATVVLSSVTSRVPRFSRTANYGDGVIVVSAALKGGVGKTTSAVYLAAVAVSSGNSVYLVDADPQASAADWIENSSDDWLRKVSVVEAPTDRLLLKALDRVAGGDVAVVDTPPGQERLLSKALERASVVVVPTRVGGVETSRATAVLDLIPAGTPAGLVISSARTFTRDYHEALARWSQAGVPVWGTVPERVAIAAGPDEWLATDGLDAYRSVWRRALQAAS